MGNVRGWKIASSVVCCRVGWKKFRRWLMRESYNAHPCRGRYVVPSHGPEKFVCNGVCYLICFSIGTMKLGQPKQKCNKTNK